MSNVYRSVYYRLRVEDPPNSEIQVPVIITGDPIVTERLTGTVTRVLQVQVNDTTGFDRGQEIDLFKYETVGATTEVQFHGVIHEIEGTPPVWTCVSYKARTRRVPTGDHNLTGMTDGEAVMHVLDQCNVPYTAADILESGYVLGQVRPVYWHKDQPGSDLIRQIDEVFGFTTIDIANGRMIRFPVKWTPLNADITHTYTQGVDPTFWSNRRRRSGADDIINQVNVTGLSWTPEEDDADFATGSGCTLTYWGRAEGANANLGSTINRSRGQSYSSDFIQSEALAKSVARRLIRLGNRMPDTITLVTLNDITVYPGVVIGVQDTQAGNDLTAVATSAPFLVTAVDRRGEEMTLNCMAGGAGTWDTLTSGLQKVCNKDGSTTTTDPAPWEDL